MAAHRVSNKAWSSGVLLAILATAGLAVLDAGPAGNSHSARYQFGQDTYATAVNALGEHVALADFAGSYVWVDYAAEWCSSCQPQSTAIRSLANVAPDNVVFVTVMTSELGGYGHPATQETASRWAQRMSLEPAHVVAADLTALTLPQHALFSPDGELLHRYTGALSAADIRGILASEGRTF